MLAPDTLVQGRYRNVRQIGQGGMGAVYQAVDQRLGNVVALKQTLVGGPQFSKAFERGRACWPCCATRHCRR
jgi:serine/threonine protein kinase